MSTVLIATLNSLATLAPDEIANRLNNRGWVRGKTMTADQLEVMRGKTVMLCIRTQSEGMTRPYEWGPREYRFTWNLREVNGSLTDYHFILKENFQDGVFPEPHPAS